VSDKIEGLDYGADDYLTKPFATGELLARVRALTRRKGEFVGDELEFGDVRLDKNTQELIHSGNRVKLGLKEYQVMEMLMENAGIIIQTDRFVEKIWGYDSDSEYNAVEVYISFLRKKLAAIGSTVEIKSTRGVGYSL
jgi:DNA-binding response OmpR family regulator